MKKVTFTNSIGQSVELGYTAPYILSNIEGLGDVGADNQRQKAPYQDGSTYIDTNLEDRFINMEVTILSKDTPEKRREIASVFNPKLGEGLLRYEDKYVTREIKAVAEHIPSFPSGDSRGRVNQTCLIDLVCPNPYWQSPTIEEDPAFEPLFEWPSDYWELGDDGDIYFEMGLQRSDRIINNVGDAPAPLQINFYGPAGAPYIENTTTGEFIQINRPLGENEILKIDTGEKSVVYVEEDGTESNAFNWLDLSSTFFELQIGENEISCQCAVSNNVRDFDIFYNKLYTAV